MKIRIALLTALVFAVNVCVYAQKAKTKTDPIGVGAVAPDFTLSNSAKEKITLSKVNKLTVLVFYRGYW